MLRITPLGGTNRVVLVLEGRLLGEWVAELEHCWHASAGMGRQVCVDLTKVAFVDDAGKQLISRMSTAGVEFSVAGPMMTEIVRECVFHGMPGRVK